VAAVSGLLRGRLAIGFVQPLPDRRFTGLAGAFHREHPGIELRLIEGETDALLADLKAGQLDAVLIGLGSYDRLPPDVMSRLVAREPAVAVVHPGHPLAGRGSIALGALRDSPMVALTSSSRQRSNLEAACRAAGFAPRIVAETSDLGVTVELIRQQIGVAILPQSALPQTPDTVVPLTLTRPKLERRILLAWPTGTSPPAVRAFLAMAQHHLAGPDPGPARGRP
jgi:DNA-binding transcriptional LysR family regulator